MSNFFSMKLQSINMDQMLLETDRKQDQERKILVIFCCHFTVQQSSDH